MKRGQFFLGSVFIYIIMLVVVGMVLLLGYNFISNLGASSKEMELRNFAITLENNLKSNIASAKLGEGSVEIVGLSLPMDVEEVCFIDLFNEIDQFVNNELNHYIGIYPQKNVFLKPFDKFIPLGIEYFELNPLENPLCLKVYNGKLNLKLISRYEKTQITNVEEEDKVEDCISVVYNGDPEEKVDIVFLGDRYKKEEEFASDVNNYINTVFLAIEPFKSNKDKLNFYRIDKFGNLGCKIQSWVECDEFKVKALASDCPNDYTIVLTDRSLIADIVRPVRSSSYSNLMSINTEENKKVVIHEFGHSFADLADEYVDESYYSTINFNARNYPNCDMVECPKWIGTVDTGCFGGCSLKTYFRPTKNSIMKDIGSDEFGPVNENEILRLLRFYEK